MDEQHIKEAVAGILALRPKPRVYESNQDHLRAVKRRHDELAFNRELDAIERDEPIVPMSFDTTRLFGMR